MITHVLPHAEMPLLLINNGILIHYAFIWNSKHIEMAVQIFLSKSHSDEQVALDITK